MTRVSSSAISVPNLSSWLNLCVFAATLFCFQAQGATEEARAALEADPSIDRAPNAILVNFRDDATPAQRQQARGLVGGALTRGYASVRLLELLELPPGQSLDTAIQRLQQLPFVEYAEPDYVLRANTSDTYYGLQWGLENTGQEIRGIAGTPGADIDAEIAWNYSIGDPNLVIAVIDTGVQYSHEDLDSNMWVNPGEIPGNGIDDDANGFVDDVHGYDFYAGDGDPDDSEGHGTHVAGTICAEGNDAEGVAGVVWQCDIMALRFLGPDGGYTSDAIAALEYAVAQGVRLSNNSWGGGGFSQSLHDAIAAAGAQGHLFVAAAGNDAVNTDSSPHYPSSYTLDNLISVAAIDNRDQLASFSNYGATSVDLGAPGVDIASTYTGNGYVWSSGTSMAAPYVAGVAALLWSAHPEWDYLGVRERLLGTVRPIAALDGVTVTGGVVNANNAMQSPAAPPYAPSDLSATAIAYDQVDLSWSDNSDNEAGFGIEQSTDGGSSWSALDKLGSNVGSYSDTSVSAESSYSYRVYAYNSSGDSSYSNTASATTPAAPSGQQVVSSGEIAGTGLVSGTYVDTWKDDGVTQTITEQHSGGRPSSRYSSLEHTWVFEVPEGSAVFYMNAWSDASSDGDSFVFSFSDDGASFVEMLRLDGGGSGDWYSYAFLPNTSGTLHIRVRDTDQTPGNASDDSLYLDQLYIQSEAAVGDPPNAPSNLSGAAVTGQIDLAWSDNSDDELGFEVERALSGSGSWSVLNTLDADSQSYSDTSVASETIYDYRVRAFNGSGYSSYSDVVTVTSMLSSSLELSAAAYKVKGWQNVDLSWTSDHHVDIYRDGAQIATTSGGSYSDTNISKGGGSYTYEVCFAGTSDCSNVAVVAF